MLSQLGRARRPFGAGDALPSRAQLRPAQPCSRGLVHGSRAPRHCARALTVDEAAAADTALLPQLLEVATLAAQKGAEVRRGRGGVGEWVQGRRGAACMIRQCHGVQLPPDIMRMQGGDAICSQECLHAMHVNRHCIQVYYTRQCTFNSAAGGARGARQAAVHHVQGGCWHGCMRMRMATDALATHRVRPLAYNLQAACSPPCACIDCPACFMLHDEVPCELRLAVLTSGCFVHLPQRVRLTPGLLECCAAPPVPARLAQAWAG